MKLVMLDTATLGEDIDLSPLAKIAQITETVEYKSTAPELVTERISDADIIILNKIKITERELLGAKVLKLICITATGYDNIDTEACARHGVALCNVPAYSTDSVAQITAAMALTLVCRLGEYRDFVHSGAYTASGVANSLTPVYHELSSMTWGIVGGGGIGSRVACIAEALGAHVLMCRRKPDERYEQVDIDTLCERSDIISLHVPLSDGTRGMIDRERIGKMKDGAILINVSRGAVTDEAALADAIKSGKLGGLGVDVYSREPFGCDHPFCDLLDDPRVCLTPHMAWGAAEARARCISIIASNISAYLADERKNRIV